MVKGFKGKKHSEESKRKMSNRASMQIILGIRKGDFKKGHEVPQEWRNKFKTYFIGNHWGHHTKESKEKIARTRRGELNWIHRPEVKQKMINSLKEGYASGKIKLNSGCFKKGNIPFSKEKRLSEGHKINLRGERPKLHGNTNGKYFWFKSGEEHPNWNGGTSFIPYPKEFKLIKNEIRKKYNYTCQQCGFTQKQLDYKLPIHHIDFNKNNNFEHNLIPLCRTCHAQTNFNRSDWINYFNNKVK